MKKFIHKIYLLGTSSLIFGSLLAAGKGFDIVSIFKTLPGIAFLTIMLISTFIYMLTDNKGAKVDKTANVEKYSFKKFDVEKQIIEKFLSEIIHTDDESVKITFTLNEQLINIQIALKKVADVNVANLVDSLKKKIEMGLDEKFEVTEEFELKFTVEENKIEE